MSCETFAGLNKARQDGADRIYGFPVRRRNQPTIYELRAVDWQGKVLFKRQLQGELYVAAVKHWCTLTPPNTAMLPEGE